VGNRNELGEKQNGKPAALGMLPVLLCVLLFADVRQMLMHKLEDLEVANFQN
jgi:hypothetical protein